MLQTWTPRARSANVPTTKDKRIKPPGYVESTAGFYNIVVDVVVVFSQVVWLVDDLKKVQF